MSLVAYMQPPGFLVIEQTGGWCGNAILEPLAVNPVEECDCGYTADCHTSDCCKCCYGQNGNNDDPNACKRRPGEETPEIN